MTAPFGAPVINVEGPTPTRDSSSDDTSLLGAREKRAARRIVRYNTKSDNKQWPSYGNGPDIVCEQAATPTSAFMTPSPEAETSNIPDTPLPGAGIPDQHWPNHVRPGLAADVPSATSSVSSSSSSRRSSRIYVPSAGKTYEDRVAGHHGNVPALSVTVPFRQPKFGPPLRVKPQSPAPVADRTPKAYAAAARVEPPPAYDAGSYMGHFASGPSGAEKASETAVEANSPWNPLSTAVSLRSEPLDTPHANALLNEKYHSDPAGSRAARGAINKKRKIIIAIFLAVLVMAIIGGIGYAVSTELNKAPDMSSRMPDHYDDESTVGWVFVPTDPNMMPKPVSKRWFQ